MRVAIIADDLTGAMDAAAPFAARGLATRVFPEPALPDDPAALDADVVAVNTESRHVGPRQAAAVVAACTRRLALARPEILLKKIDSTLRGNVAVEIAAALQASSRAFALVTPAMPSQGRVLHDGRLYVHGVPLEETAIGRDALSPPPRRPLVELLREATAGHTWLAAKAGLDGPLATSVVCDAETPGDMERIARRVLAGGRQVLVCGSGGLGQALAALLGGTDRPVRPVLDTGPLLYVVGSRTPQAQAQVAALEAAGGVAVVEVAVGADCPMPRAGILVLRPATREGDPVAVSATLAAAAAQALDELAPAALVMTGGDTALACLRRLGVRSVEVADEILPGIALGRIRIAARTLAVVTKAGGFGEADVFVALRDRLVNGPT